MHDINNGDIVVLCEAVEAWIHSKAQETLAGSVSTWTGGL